jgi:hypothetical protein
MPFLALLAGCAAAEPETQAPAPAVADSPAEPAPAPAEERPLPPSIVLDASITRSGPGDGPPVTVSLRGGKPVEWTRSEFTREPTPFDPQEVVARGLFAEHLGRDFQGEGTIRVDCTIRGLPADALFLELDAAASKVTWSNGSPGTLREMSSQSARDAAWSIEVLTSAPPTDPVIGLLRIAFDVHQPTAVKRSVASLGVDDAAAFDFESVGSKWTLSSDRRVTQFSVSRHREPSHPLLREGLDPDELVRLEDANGRRLRRGIESGAGSTVMTEWRTDVEEDLEPPLRVTVDWPTATAKRRVVVHLRDIKPSR